MQVRGGCGGGLEGLGAWGLSHEGWSGKKLGHMVEGVRSKRFGCRVARDHEGRGELGWRGLGVECLGVFTGTVD